MSNRPGSMLPIAAQATKRPNPTQATGAPLGGDSQGQDSTDAFTLITQVGFAANGKTPILYNGDRRWVKITMTLQTAGIVVWGTRAEFGDIASGNGSELQTNVPVTVAVAKGTRIYYIASAVNRVTVQVEPLPWLEQITASAQGMLARLLGR